MGDKGWIFAYLRSITLSGSCLDWQAHYYRGLSRRNRVCSIMATGRLGIHVS